MTRYGTHESKAPENPPIALRVVPHKGVELIVSPAFGPNTYTNNLSEMQKPYSHNSKQLGTFPRFTFIPATTSESISAVAWNFEEEAKPQIFDSNWLQLGRIVRTPEGVFTNTQETDEEKLKSLLDNSKKVNRIYLIDNRIAFAPYETFQRGVQEAGDFAVNPKTNGLARALEHTRGKKAENLAQISDKRLYKLGVDVRGFNPTKEPVSKVVSFLSYRCAGSGRLNVYGDWNDSDVGDGFGVFDVAEGDAPKN